MGILPRECFLRKSHHPKLLAFATLSTRIKDAGIALCHLQERILFYIAGSRKGLAAVVTCRDMEGLIKLAASAASRKPTSREGSSREAGRRLGWQGTASGRSPAASFPAFALPEGCANSRLDHGLKFQVLATVAGPKALKFSDSGGGRC